MGKQNNALKALYRAYPMGPMDGSPEEAAHINSLSRKISRCGSCGEELMNGEDGFLKHHDGRFSYGKEENHESKYDHPAHILTVFKGEEPARPLVGEGSTTDDGLLKPAVNRNLGKQFK